MEARRAMKPFLRWLSERARSLAFRLDDLADWLHEQSRTPDLSIPYECTVDWHRHSVTGHNPEDAQ